MTFKERVEEIRQKYKIIDGLKNYEVDQFFNNVHFLLQAVEIQREALEKIGFEYPTEFYRSCMPEWYVRERNDLVNKAQIALSRLERLGDNK